MLLLTSTSDLVRVVTDAAGDIEVHASYMDHSAGVFTPARTNTASITTATTTTVVASPAASTQRNVKHLNIRNNHASQAVLVTVFHTDGTTQEDLFECTLLAGEALIFTQGGVWLHYDVNGGTYPQVGAQASQAEMEAATSLVTTVSPGRLHFHPGVIKHWYRVTVSGGTPTLQQSYNVTSITDTATGQLTVTIATDYSSAGYCILHGCERANTTTTVANARQDEIRNATPAAGSYIHECWDDSATNNVLADPATWYGAGLGDFA